MRRYRLGLPAIDVITRKAFVYDYRSLAATRVRYLESHNRAEVCAPKGLPMTSTTSIQQLNRELGDQLIAEAKQNPQSRYLGKYVGIANGQITIVADDLDDVVQHLDQVEPDASKTFCLEIGPDYDKVYEIWEIH
jgi:hypothetical protein